MSKKRQSRKSKRRSGRTSSLRTSQSAGSKLKAEGFNPDYSQTIKDLKRIGMLAGTFFIILVGLAIFLR